MKKRAFTLVEMLVVVAILGILIAILLPVFSATSARSPLDTCLDNNRALGTAFMVYMEDTDHTLPLWALGSVVPPPRFSNMTWDVSIFPFVRNKRSFTCPSVNVPLMRQATDADPLRTYTMPQNVSGLRMIKIKSPARTVLLYEKGSYLCGTASDATGEYFGQSTGGASDLTKTYPNDPTKWGMRHRFGKVFLFTDGHAAWYPAIPGSTSLTNPFGYYFPNSATGGWPKGAAGVGYCGSADALHAGAPTIPGANLPDQP